MYGRQDSRYISQLTVFYCSTGSMRAYSIVPVPFKDHNVFLSFGLIIALLSYVLDLDRRRLR